MITQIPPRRSCHLFDGRGVCKSYHQLKQSQEQRLRVFHYVAAEGRPESLAGGDDRGLGTWEPFRPCKGMRLWFSVLRCKGPSTNPTLLHAYALQTKIGPQHHYYLYRNYKQKHSFDNQGQECRIVVEPLRYAVIEFWPEPHAGDNISLSAKLQLTDGLGRFRRMT
jgi:hypothetical protein